MGQKQQKERRYAADHIFGAGIAVRFLSQGLQRNVSPEVVDNDVRTRLRSVYLTMDSLTKELVQLARDIAGEDEQGQGLRDTKVGP